MSTESIICHKTRNSHDFAAKGGIQKKIIILHVLQYRTPTQRSKRIEHGRHEYETRKFDFSPAVAAREKTNT